MLYILSGGVHIPIGMDLLLKALKESVDDGYQKGKDRVSMLEILMIFCKQALADHDTVTENLMDLIEKTKTQQVVRIKVDYHIESVIDKFMDCRGFSNTSTDYCFGEVQETRILTEWFCPTSIMSRLKSKRILRGSTIFIAVNFHF